MIRRCWDGHRPALELVCDRSQCATVFEAKALGIDKALDEARMAHWLIGQARIFCPPCATSRASRRPPGIRSWRAAG
jgi:hypothetical protein